MKLGLSQSLVNTRLPIVSASSFANQYSMEFDGVNDYVQLVPTIPLGVTSVSLWMKSTDLVNGGVSTGLGALNFIGGTRKPLIFLGPGNYKYFPDQLSKFDGNWHHWFILITGADRYDINNCRLFVDGAEIGAGTVGNTSGFPNPWTSSLIGKGQYGALFCNVDEFAVWQSDETANVTDIYNSGVPTDLTSLSPLAWYRMGDNGAFLDPQWLLPNNENKDNYSNYSLDFDGTNDSIIFITPKDIGETQQISYSVWVNLDVTTRQYIAGNWLSSNGGTGLSIETGDVLIFQMADGTNDSYFGSRVAGFSTYAPINTWNHILATWDGTDSKIYINGVLRNTWTPAGGYTISGYSTTGFKIGWRGQFAYLTNGKLDEIGLFKSGVSIGDVWDGTGKPIDISTVSGITHNWKLGEDATFDGTNWTLPDIVGSKPGTTTNMDISDRVGDAPGSVNNAISVNMDRFDKVEDVPT